MKPSLAEPAAPTTSRSGTIADSGHRVAASPYLRVASMRRTADRPARPMRVTALALVALLSVSPAYVRAQHQDYQAGPLAREGGSFTGLAQAPEANLFLGAATTSIPIAVPPGRNNLTPQLALTYASNGGSSPYGHGWDLPVGHIQRSTKHGVLTCGNLQYREDFVLVLPGQSVEFTRDAGGRGVPLVEKAFLKIQHKASQNYWEVWDKSGIRYRFGESLDARTGNDIIDLYHSQSCPDSTTYDPLYTFSWGLTSIEDPNGNRLEIQYVPTTNQTDGVMYPDRLLYGGHTSGFAHQFEVDFVWSGGRPAGDEIVNGMRGIAAKLKQYLTDIVIRHPVGGTVVRRYALDYDFDIGPLRIGRQTFLSAVTLYDANNQALSRYDGLPASTTFLYQQNRPDDGRFGFGTAQHAPKPPPAPPLSFMYGRHTAVDGSFTSRDIFDMNGDGFADWIRPSCSSSWFVHLGSAAGFARTPVVWNMPGSYCYIRTAHDAGDDPRHTYGDIDTLDLNGDSIPDLIDSTVWSATAPYWKVYLGYVTGAGGGFATTPLSWPAARKELRHTEAATTVGLGYGEAAGSVDHRDLIDLNSDGLLDLVESDSRSSSWIVWLNTGSGFDQSGRVFNAQFNVLRWTRRDEEIIGLYDMNGDGLLDQVFVGFGNVNPWPGFWYVYLNNGHGVDSAEQWYLPASPGGRTIRRMNSDYSDILRTLVDLNGDGLPDLVDQSGWTATRPYWQVVLNRGDGFSPDALAWYSPVAVIRDGEDGKTYRDTADLDGDGLPDLVDFSTDLDVIKIYRNTGGAWCASGDGLTCATTPGTAGVAPNPDGLRADLLVQMENGIGGTTALEYRPSTQWDNAGGDGVVDLPFTTWTVTRVERDDGMCDASGGGCVNAGGHTLVTNLTYTNGRYDTVNRVFRGFQLVDTKDADPTTARYRGRLTFFHQSAALSGHVMDHWVYDASNGGTFVLQPLGRTYTIWECANPATGAVMVCPAQPAGNAWARQRRVDEYTFTNFQVATYRQATTETHSWHQCGGRFYGNVAHVSGGDASGTMRKHTHTGYACVDTSATYIVDKPTHAWVNASNDASTLEEKWFFYDQQPYGNLTKGNLSKVESWLDQWAEPSVNCTASSKQCVNTRMEYDTYGNVVRVYDALNRLTETQYESTTRIYPSVVTDALQHKKATGYDAACGARTWESIRYTGASIPAERSQWRYDSFCRLRATALPDEDPTTSPHEIVYYTLGCPRRPTQISTWTREPTANLGFRRTHVLTDALGRVIQQQRTAVIDGVSQTALTTTEYDSRGHVSRQYAPFASAAGSYVPPPPATGLTSFTTDALNRVTRATNPDGTYRETDYRVAWQTTNQDECYTAANCTGGKTVEIRDALGRVTEKRLYEEDSFKTRTVYTQDELGRLLTTRQGGSETTLNENTRITLAYDTLGHKTQMTDPNSGTWRYGYDAVGNLRYQDDPKANQHVQFCYDALNRVTRECPIASDYVALSSCGSAQSCTAEKVEYAYDSAVPAVPYGLGRLTRVDDGSGRTAFEQYDVRGRLRQVTKEVDPYGDGQNVTSATTGFVYDLADHLTELTYPDGEVVRYQYDAAGQVVKVSSVTHQQDYLTSLTYDVFGRPRTLTHANGTIDARTYGGASAGYRLARIATSAGSALRLSYGYASYSPLGRLRQLTDDGPKGAGNIMDASATFTYDGLGRLAQAAGPQLGTRTYQHDYLGNMTQKDGVLLTYSTTKPHTLSQINGSGAGISHDTNGNRLGKPNQTYAYDAQDRLTQINNGQVRYRYDYTGRRVAKLVGSTVTRYYSQLMDASGGWVTKYYFAGDLLIATRRQQSAGLGAVPQGAIRLARVSLTRPAIVLLLRRDAQLGVALSLGLLAAGLLLAPSRRRRTVGIAIRHGHVIGVVLTFSAGTGPWPLVLRPAPAEAQLCAPPSTVVYHYHLDHLGSTQLITNSSGAAVEYVRYKPYGEVRGRYDANGAAITANEIHRTEFTGYESEFLSGLQYAGARFYDPALGMFLTHDPARQFPNPYSYTGGDPVNQTDPNGAFVVEFLVAMVIGALVSAAVNTVIAAAQGATLAQIGKSALGSAITGAVGVGLGVVASGLSTSVSALAGTLPENVGLQQAMNALGEVAYRSAFSTIVANAAGQTAAAAGAPNGAVTAVSVVAGFGASYAYDSSFIDYNGDLAKVEGKGAFQNASDTATHAGVTNKAAGVAGFSRSETEMIARSNLAQDLDVANNESHFGFGARDAFRRFAKAALETKDIRYVGAASHYVQDQYVLGHIFPGTNLLAGPVGAPFRFLTHQTLGGEINFFRIAGGLRIPSSFDATVEYFAATREFVVPGTAL